MGSHRARACYDRAGAMSLREHDPEEGVEEPPEATRRTTIPSPYPDSSVAIGADLSAPTIAGATLLTSVTLALFFTMGFLITPSATGRQLEAIVGRPAPSSKVRLRAGAFAALLILMPFASLGLVSLLLDPTDALTMPWRGIGVLVVATSIAPLFLRLPLVTLGTVVDPERAWRVRLARSITLATNDALATLGLTVGIALASALSIGCAFALQGVVSELALPSVALFALPVASLPIWLTLARRMEPNAAPPRPRLGVLAALFALPFVLLLDAGVAAMAHPRPLTIVVDGEGRQPVRGMMNEQGPRGSYEGDGFRVTGRYGELVIERAGALPEAIASRYDASAALMRARPCDGLRARLHPDCQHIALTGPDWEMALLVNARGERLDDTPWDRAIERLGTPGALSVIVALGVLLLTLIAWTRIRRLVRRLTGGDRRHRLEGLLTLGEDARIEVDGGGGARLFGERNLVTLRDGDRVLRLQAEQPCVAIEERVRAGIARGAAALEHKIPVRVALDALPSVDALRTMDAPIPDEAALVVGDPEAIERDAAVRAIERVSPLLLAAQLLASAAGMALLFA